MDILSHKKLMYNCVDLSPRYVSLVADKLKDKQVENLLNGKHSVNYRY